MEDKHLQLLLYGKDLEDVQVHLHHHHGVHLKDVIPTENPDLLIVNVDVAHHIHGAHEFTIEIKKGEEKQEINYELKARNQQRPLGFNSSDYIYLITPDRFANGDPGNDSFENMREKISDRSDDYGRHGGDLKGIADHLDYIAGLGMTSVWINPVQENDQPEASYHGYAITDSYKIDPRLGTNEEYSKLSELCHEKGIKMIMDVIPNHFGSNHPLALNPPFKKWLNKERAYNETNHLKESSMDPYASQRDKKQFKDGWFVKTMPDMNGRDPLFAKYYTQNTIWWIEEADLDGLRIDTYPYQNRLFLRDWARALLEEYPDLFMFGESWVNSPGVQAYFMGSSGTDKNFDRYVQSAMDFPLCFALNEMITEVPSWDNGSPKVYRTMAQDYLYRNPELLVGFVDNHDMGRYYGTAKGNFDKFQMGIVLMSTLNRIPCLYYGTEILMKETDGHGKIREDFPGGWSDDPVNKFDIQNLDSMERRGFDLVAGLANFRKEHPEIFKGKMVQFGPKNGLYVYSRFSKTEEIMVMANASNDSTTIDLDLYKERFQGFVEYQELLSGEKNSFGSNLRLEPWGTRVFYFRREY